MEFQFADYVLGGLVCVAAVMGLFRGFSGMLAFALASAAAILVGLLCWPYSATLTAETWQRALGTLLAVLLAFGLVRVIVRKCVNGLLAQPADAVFGLLAGLVCGALLIAVWAKVGIGTEYSNVVRLVQPYVGGPMSAGATGTSGAVGE